MLPGFRFLFAAIVLSMSILIFGLGAAALLRAAHEEFVSTPTWRATPETVFAQPAETTRPVLALLRVDAPVADKAPEQVLDNAPADATPAAITSAPAEPEHIAAPERISALKPEDSPPPDSAKPEDPVGETTAAEKTPAESPAQNEAAPAPADASAPVAETKVIDTKAIDSNVAETKVEETKTDETKSDETKVADPKIADLKTIENGIAETRIADIKVVDTKVATSESASVPANPVAPTAASEPTGPKLSPQAKIAATKIATLGGPAVTIGTPRPVKAGSTKPDPNVTKKRQQAKRAVQRRRVAVRAQVTAQIPQQPVNPFGQPAPTIVRSR